MGKLILPPSGPVYVDANAVIYLVERIEPYFSTTLPLWQALNDGKQEVVTSQLTLLEVLVKPLKDGKKDLADLFRKTLLATAGFTCRPIDLPTLSKAAHLRATVGLKTPDALHAAAAHEAGCTLLLTNDNAFRRVTGLNVAVLSEIIAP